ncbi:MAG: hypothetical protein HY094_04820 [Candidatus Melainabacteria bacterium]|nr:hypothetical protein [Candidatus Melainabacteria bacterium]
MSLTTHPVNILPSQKANKPNKFTRLFAPLVLGTALALGGTAPVIAAEAEQPNPNNNVPAENKKDENCSPHKFLFGYITGAIMGHLLEKLHQKNKS